MSDVYSDLNVKNGSKIVLGESGVAISSSGCVVLGDGSSKDLSDMATNSYVDENFIPLTSDEQVIFSGCGFTFNTPYNGAIFRIPGKTGGNYVLATTDDIPSCETISGDYLPVTTDECGNYYIGNKVRINDEISIGTDNSCSTDDITEYTVSGKLVAHGESVDFVSGCMVLICASGGACIRSWGGVKIQSGCSLFNFPYKGNGTYTLATTEDIGGSGSGSGCTYPTCYPLYYSCCVVGELYYDGKKVLLESKGIDINIEASNDFVVKAGCSTYFMCDACFSAFCVFVPSHLPYMGGKVQSTIVTSPGYTESGCGLQICVLTQSEYNSMSQHGMTTLYFIKPEI